MSAGTERRRTLLILGVAAFLTGMALMQLALLWVDPTDAWMALRNVTLIVCVPLLCWHTWRASRS